VETLRAEELLDVRLPDAKNGKHAVGSRPERQRPHNQYQARTTRAARAVGDEWWISTIPAKTVEYAQRAGKVETLDEGVFHAGLPGAR